MKCLKLLEMLTEFKRGEDIMERVFEWESGPQRYNQETYERLLW